jgi:hypothetical protein
MQITLTPQQFTDAVERLEKNYGITATTPSGALSHSGVTVSYSYDGTGSLSVEVLDKPFYVTEHYVEGQIAGWFSAN